MWVCQFPFHLAVSGVRSTGGGFFFVLAVTPLSKIEVGMTLWTDSVIWHFCTSFLFSPFEFWLSVCITPCVGRTLSPHIWGYTHAHNFPYI